MKMSTNFAIPTYTYNTETCDSFTLALASDTPSLFEATNTWTDDANLTFTFYFQLNSFS